MKLYGLFKYTYDYHEFEELQVASHDEGKLKEWADSNIPDLEIFTAAEHEIMSNSHDERHHLLIKEIDVL